jgi:DNA adenine methylase
MNTDSTVQQSRPPHQVLLHHQQLRPFLKWAGGKRQLLPDIKNLLPVDAFNRYFEPFVGAGAVFFDLQLRNAIINDYNEELINCYRTIKDDPETLIKEVRKYPHTKEAFYTLRALDRTPEFASIPKVQRAARIIYLNKTCFNGLFRVNSRGQFNVPFGDYTNPKIIEESVIKAISEYLNSANIQILQGDFADAVKTATRGDFIYFDPPYDPVSATASFTSYSLNSFNRGAQIRLKETCDDLTKRGCKVLISNSSTEFIRDLYSNNHYTIVEVKAARNINSVGYGRDKISELLIFNNYNVGKLISG